MAIPEFYHFMKPILALHKEGRVLIIAEIEKALVSQFHITSEEQNELLPSARTTRVRSRLYWATAYMSQALLLERMGRGKTKITPRGLEYLSKLSQPD